MNHNLQTIRGLDGKPEYVLIPVQIYSSLYDQIERALEKFAEDYVPFKTEDYVRNPIALMRIQARLNKTELAKRLGVTQAYISKIERETYPVSPKLLKRVKDALRKK